MRSLLAGCVALSLFFSPAHAQEEEEYYADPPAAKAPPAWSYDGDADNQERWGDLSPDYAQCLLGLEQSPINVSNVDTDALPVLATLYDTANINAYYRSNMLELEVQGQNTLSTGGVEYTLKRIFFHMPAEHRIREKFHFAEIQFMHESRDGKIIILSSFLDIGERSNTSIDDILVYLPDKTKPDTPKKFSLDLGKLLPENRGYYAYTGSLTFPPCTQGVEWRLLKTPITATDLQVESLAKYLGRNARMVQPIYNRIIKETE